MGGCAAVERLLGRAVPAHQVDLGDIARRSMSDAEEDAPPWALSAGPSRAAVGSRPAMVARVGVRLPGSGLGDSRRSENACKHTYEAFKTIILLKIKLLHFSLKITMISRRFFKR
jgi:hypothetical protein